MCALRIVVDRSDDWRPYYPTDDLIEADTFLAQIEHTPKRIINLCTNLDYLGRGYYVSLLAQARGSRVLPSVDTLNTLRRKSTTAMQLEGLTPALEELNDLLRDEYMDSMTIEVMFGECHDPRLSRFSRRLFERLPCPLLEARLERRITGWRLLRVRPLSLKSLNVDSQELFSRALNRYSRDIWRTPRSKRRYRFDLAMLVNPEERLPPSNKGALKAFIRAGRRCGIDVALITHRDAGRLAEFDGLFLRETTALDHHTWRLARRAEHEGLCVIDAPQDILRCTNKVYLHELLRTKGVPTPQAQLLQRSSTVRLKHQAQAMDYPLVLKVPDGSFSRGIVKVSSPDELVREAQRLFASSDLLLLQEWLPTEFDWRIGVLNGTPLFASRYFMARGHWQIYDHSGKSVKSGGFTTHAIEDVPKAVIKTALKATRLIGNGLYGVDLKQIGDRVVVIEINDNPNIDAGIEDAVLGRKLYENIMAVFLQRMENRGRGRAG
uniref:RimK family protein n=1 Tax=Halomonas sp. TaxID=1486246 RepID=UPI00261A6B9A|nr:RimK family protein [Halomonas sp.]